MKFTLSGILAWGIGILLVLLGIIALALGPGGLLIIAVGLFALPPVRRALANRADVEFSTWLVAVIVIVGFFGGLVLSVPDDGAAGTIDDGSDGAAGAVDAGPQQQDDVAPTETSEPQPEEVTETQAESSINSHEVGDTFTVGDGDESVQYTVLSVETREKIGSGFLEESADGVFVVVRMEMTNVGKESFTITDSPYHLIDSQGRSYETDSDAIFAVEDNVIFEQLDPDVTKEAVLVFDVPEDQKDRQLRIEPVGIFSSADAHLVNLE